MATPDGANSRAAVRTWIEQTPESDAEQFEDGEGNFASFLYGSCMNLFEMLYKESSRSGSFSKTEQRHLKENLGRLFLWGDGFGGGMLDRLLGQSIDLRNSVLGFIAGIGRVLTGKVLTIVCETQQEGKIFKQADDLNNLIEKAESIIVEDSHLVDKDSEQNSDSDPFDCSKFDILEDISCYTLCLMELVPSMERTLTLLDERQTEGLLPTVSFQVSEPARVYVQSVHDMFPFADDKLIERLGEVTWRRSMYVRQQMENVSSHTTPVRNEEPTIPGAGSAVFKRYSVLGESASGTSLPPQSTYAASIASDDSLEFSNADHSDELKSVLSTPSEVAAGKPFQCRVCGKMLENITQSIAWKHHVLSDLGPYTCTSPTCKDGLVTFPTRKLWADHEFSEHRTEKLWHCMECADTFPEVELWRKHVGSRHDIFFSEPQFDIAAALAEHSECPLCLTFVGVTRRVFAAHVGKHMEKIALTALPPEIDPDTEAEPELSEQDTHSVCTEDGPEAITSKLDVASDPGTVSTVESDQQGREIVDTETSTGGDTQKLSGLKSRPSALPGTDTVTPPPRSKYQKHPQYSNRGGSSQHMNFKWPPPKGEPTISCQHCRRYKIRCSGFTPEHGRCTECQRWALECSFTPVTSQAQASVPAPTAYSNLRNTEAFKEKYPFNIAVPGAHVSCSAFVLQSRVPEARWEKLPDTTILQSLAELFFCTEFNFGTVNLRVLKITLRCEAMKVAYLVDREDTQQFELIKRSIEQQVKLQLQRNKDNRIHVELFIEPKDTNGTSLDHSADENEGQAQPPRLWNFGTPVGERLVTPNLPIKTSRSVMELPKSEYSKVPKENPSALPTQEPRLVMWYDHPEPSSRAELKTQVEGLADGEYSLTAMELGAVRDIGKRKESESNKERPLKEFLDRRKLHRHDRRRGEGAPERKPVNE